LASRTQKTERVVIRQAEADRLMAAHARFVARRPGGRRMVQRFAVMEGVDLSNQDLSDIDLTGSSLIGCKFDYSRLTRACLFGVDLQSSRLVGASLTQADLRGARLKGANLSHANLTQADLRAGRIAISDEDTRFSVLRHKVEAGQLDGANVTGAVLDRSRLDDVSAAAADFSECSMRGTKLVGANLKNASLRGAMIDDVDVTGANLDSVDLTGAVLTRVDLSAARTRDLILKGCLCDPTPEASQRAALLFVKLASHREWVATGGKSGEPAILDGEDLRPIAGLAGAFLTAVSARRACLAGVDLGRAALQGAILEGADLRGASLRKADLRGANLAGANLGQADLREALLGALPLKADREKPMRLDRASLRFADLRDTVLEGVDLDEADLHGARRDRPVSLAPETPPEEADGHHHAAAQDESFVVDM